MATPQESITTVNGRRCTRSRARTLVPSIVTSEAPAVITPTEVTLSTPVEQAPQVQSSAAEAAPPPPPPPPPLPASSAAAAPLVSLAPAEQPVAAPIPTQIVASSAAPDFVAVAPSAPRAAGPNGQVEQPSASTPAAGPPQGAVIATDAPQAPVPAPTSSDSSFAAVLPLPTESSTRQTPLATASEIVESAVLPSSIATDPEQPSQVDNAPQPTSLDPLVGAPSQPTTTPAPALPSGDTTSGVIGPELGSSDGGGLTIPSSGDANIGSIAGGVIGGVAGLALICALLFYCLRKRKTKQPRWVEKKVEGPRLVEKVQGIPAGVSVILAKIKGMRAGPSRNPYRRHSQQDSISSIYSANTNGRDGFFAAEVPVRRSSSRKSERNRLRKKNSSVSSQSALVDILEDREKEPANPFNDPEPPRVLRLSNPDAKQSPRGPLTPQPAVTQANPFDTPFDDPAVPPGWPEAMPPALGHKRTQSSASALSSHPPSLVFAGSSTMSKGPLNTPPVAQAVAPTPQRRSSMAYPTFDATSTGGSRISDLTLYGDRGSSRPGTNLFTPGMRTGRTVRQSDPFDLDRPEVLGFGNVVGRKEVRASVTRQGTRGRRTSSAANTNDGTYTMHSAAGRR